MLKLFFTSIFLEIKNKSSLFFLTFVFRKSHSLTILMMNRFLTLITLLLCWIGSCSAQSAITSLMRKTYAKPDRIYQFYVQHQPDSIYEAGRSLFSHYFTPTQFAEQVQMLDQKLGDVKQADLWQHQKQMQYDIYSRQLTYAAYTATLVVGFDDEGNLMAFQLTNEQPLLAENEREITIENDGLKLPGRLSLPSSAVAKSPAVILVHGSGPCDMNESMGAQMPFKDLADALSKQGIAVIRYDKRTKVSPTGWMPAGKPGNYDTETVDDVLAAIRLAQSQPEVDSSRIYIVGHSLGAALAPRIAQRCPSVRGIVLMAAPTRKLIPTIEEQLRYLGVSADTIALQVSQVKASLPEGYLDFDAQYDPIATAKKLSLPMLVLQGERDYQVTQTDFSAWQKAMKGRKNVTLKLYPKLNHLFSQGEGKPSPDEYMQPGYVDSSVVADIVQFVTSSAQR